MVLIDSAVPSGTDNSFTHIIEGTKTAHKY